MAATSRSPAWPRIWAENDSLLKEARRISYLVHVAADGTLACKACGVYVPWEPPELHFARHMKELDDYLAKKQEGKREQTAEGFYPNPCTSCGNRIPRTGKPGRPPQKCTKCEYPLSALQSEPDGEAAALLTDEELLRELGL